jgi:DNA-directed RNA polymerase subunit RPC12/RpoP
MNTLKYSLWVLLSKIEFFYFVLIILNIFENIPSTLNIIAGVSLILICVFFSEFGTPQRKICEKCGSKIQLFYTLESGDDRREPNKYEHIYKVEECPRCRNKVMLHLKKEKRKHVRAW